MPKDIGYASGGGFGLKRKPKAKKPKKPKVSSFQQRLKDKAIGNYIEKKLRGGQIEVDEDGQKRIKMKDGSILML